MKPLNRRTFLKSSLYTGVAVSFSARSWAQVAGANSSIRTAIVGFRGRGGAHISSFRNLGAEGVKLVALCDVDEKVLNAGVEAAKKKNETVEGFRDLRKLLEKKDIDVVSIATPNHWHALQAIWAIQAGKDVYVEKPVSHNVWEGRKIVEAARKYNRIVQTGTQSRSSSGIAEAVKWVQAGNLGKIEIARGLCYKRRDSIGTTQGEQPVPTEIEYDLWCGPAPKSPLRREKLHYDWHWFWDYGNGDLGNQGIHQMDIARWFLGVNELSPRVLSVGGRLGYKDDGETPNTQIVYHAYRKAPLIFEVRGLPAEPGAVATDGKKRTETMDKFMGASVGVVIHCEGGYITVPGYTGATAYDKDGKQIKEFKGASDHFDNFIAAVKSRKRSDLHADIWEGHLSSALCHTGNISYRLGKQANPDAIRERIKALKGGEECYDRMIEHLARNHVDIAKDRLTLGLMLNMDPKTEKFIGNQNADALLTREYRKPFVVPERV